MADGCSDTSVAAIVNGFVEILREKRKITLVGFDDDLSKKSIPIGSAVAVVYLPNGTLIANLKNTPLLHGGSNSLLLKAKARFFVAIHADTKSHGDIQYIHSDNLVIPMKVGKGLLYLPI